MRTPEEISALPEAYSQAILDSEFWILSTNQLADASAAHAPTSGRELQPPG